MARDSAEGLYTKELVASMDEAEVARLLNGLVGRVNYDEARDAKRTAYTILAFAIASGLVVGALVATICIFVAFNPIRGVEQAIREVSTRGK